MRNVLKYPGSKWNIATQIVNLVPKHHSYVEPYFGSGAVLFNKTESAIETVNDLDSDVINLFRCIQKDSERLARIVMTTPFSREVYDKEFEEEMEFKIVGSTEANSLQNKISNESPVGHALIGKKVGDIVDVETQAGVIQYEVLDIKRVD